MQYKLWLIRQPIAPPERTLLHFAIGQIANREVIVISRRNSEDVALISAKELSGILETAHLLRSPKNATQRPDKQPVERESIFHPEFREDLRYWIRNDRKIALRAFDLIRSNHAPFCRHRKAVTAQVSDIRRLVKTID